MHGTMAVNPAHRREGGRYDDHPEVAFTFLAPAAMAAMLIAFIDNIQRGRREGSSQARMNFIRYPHFQPFTPSIPRRKP